MNLCHRCRMLISTSACAVYKRSVYYDNYPSGACAKCALLCMRAISKMAGVSDLLAAAFSSSLSTSILTYDQYEADDLA